MDTILTLRGIFSAETPDAPLQFEPRSIPLHDAVRSPAGQLDAEINIVLRIGAAFIAIAAGEDEVAVGLLDGRGCAWLIRGAAMPFHLRACLDHISAAGEVLPPDWGIVLLMGLSPKVSPEKAAELESLIVRAASKASGGRYLLGFASATVQNDRLIYHIISEQEVADMLAGLPPSATSGGMAVT